LDRVWIAAPLREYDMNDVLVEWRGDAIWIRLNRPERRNAYDPPMADAIIAALEDAPRARAVVITGSGGSFCAGGALTTLSHPTVGAMRSLYATSLRLIGEKRAKELALLCRRYSADDAYRMGLVNDVVDDERLEERVGEWVAELAVLSPRYLEITKISSNIWWNSARDSFSTGLGMLVQALAAPDIAEGATAFLEKRAPTFPPPE
jgi:enoyl-CoA hydratase/carnithine racemase